MARGAVSVRRAVENGATRCRACCFPRCARYGEKNGFTLLQCVRCHSVQVPAPEEEAIDAIYESYYTADAADAPPATAATLKDLLTRFAVHRETGRWLDVGYGQGALLRAASHVGWECFGAEISPPALQIGEREGWTVTSRLEDDPRFQDASFDVVSMIELIEHVPDPDTLLQTALRKLRPGGALYLTTPNARSLNARLLRERWSVYAPPEHLTVWSKRGLSAALARIGFTVRRVQTHGLNPYELRSVLRPQPAVVRAADRVSHGASLNEAFSRSPLRRRVKTVLNGTLSLLGAGDTIKIQAERPRSGT